FIHELNNTECQKVLGRNKVGHLACAHDNQPYVMPLNYAYDGNYLYAFTTRGQKVEWMRSNPLICFEVDEVSGHTDWTSIIVFGHYEELPDKPEYEPSRIRAHAFTQKRAAWGEPAYISQEHRDQPHSLTPIFFRIRVDIMTGHRANSEDSESPRL